MDAVTGVVAGRGSVRPAVQEAGGVHSEGEDEADWALAKQYVFCLPRVGMLELAV